MKKTRREEERRRRERQRTMTRVLWIGGAALLVAAVAFGLQASARPALGEEIEVMPDVSHVADGTDPGPYNSDPPPSGRHYADPYEGGFYEEDVAQPAYPEGHLVHNLEHGYIIFWYNCALAGETGCEELKAEIRSVMDQADNFKVIAYPWESTDVPVVLTSWGRMMKFEEFDASLALEFVESNRNKAPEPEAP